MSRGSGKKMLGLSRFRAYRSAIVLTRTAPFGRGFASPTVYFPLIVHEAMMIEPTESEARETLDEFVEAMKGIAEQVKTDPAAIHAAPVTTPVGRPDEVTAARKPIVKYEG